MSVLSLNPAIVLAPSADGYIAYDTQANRLHELNPAAALLAELCDGNRLAADVVKLALPLLPPDSEDAAQQWLELAREERVLLETSEVEAQKLEEPSAEDLVKRAESLRGNSLKMYILSKKRKISSQVKPKSYIIAHSRND